MRCGAVPAGSLWLITREEGFRGLYKGLGPTLIVLPPNWAIYFSSYDRLRRAMGYDPGGAARGAEASVPFGVNMLAAGGAGAVTAVATNPLWVVKARLQIQDMGVVVGRHFKAPYRNTFDALRRIALEEGVRGLYCGLTPALLGTAHVLIQFPAYEAVKERLARDAGSSVSDLNALQLSAASMAGKLVASTCTYPHEVIRSRMQIAGETSGIGKQVKEIFRDDGMRGFYRGFFVNLVRTLPTAAITFTSYELIARHLQAPAGDGIRPPQEIGGG